MKWNYSNLKKYRCFRRERRHFCCYSAALPRLKDHTLPIPVRVLHSGGRRVLCAAPVPNERVSPASSRIRYRKEHILLRYHLEVAQQYFPLTSGAVAIVRRCWAQAFQHAAVPAILYSLGSVAYAASIIFLQLLSSAAATLGMSTEPLTALAVVFLLVSIPWLLVRRCTLAKCFVCLYKTFPISDICHNLNPPRMC